MTRDEITKKVFSGRFILAVIAGACLLAFCGTLCSILWRQPTVDLNDTIAMLLGAVLGFIGTIITSYFRKKENDQ